MSRILIATHTQATRHYLSGKLRKSGHIVTTAAHSLDAWRAVGKNVYDVLIVDVAMPGIDGFVLAQKALQENPSMQIIFVTGFAAVAMDTLATPAYAPAPVTTRPFHLTEIAPRVRYLLGHGGLPVNDMQPDGKVIYADFTAKKESKTA